MTRIRNGRILDKAYSKQSLITTGLRTSVWKLANKASCYSFKIFPGFLLVKTTRIIHHNQLLLTKFEKNLCHIEPMTSKVQSAADYLTDDAKMTLKVQPAAAYWTVYRENLVTRLKNKERNGESRSKTGKYFEWITKHLLNSAFVGCE